MSEVLAKGREAVLEGKNYRIVMVDPPGRKVLLEKCPRGETDPPPPKPAFDLREGAPLYVLDDRGRTLACLATDDVREVGKMLVSVAFVATGVVGESHV